MVMVTILLCSGSRVNLCVETWLFLRRELVVKCIVWALHLVVVVVIVVVSLLWLLLVVVCQFVLFVVCLLLARVLVSRMQERIRGC